MHLDSFPEAEMPQWAQGWHLMLARWLTKHMAWSTCYSLACRNNVWLLLKILPWTWGFITKWFMRLRNLHHGKTVILLFFPWIVMLNALKIILYNSWRGYGALLHWKMFIAVTHGPDIFGLIKEVAGINWSIQCIYCWYWQWFQNFPKLTACNVMVPA